MTYSSNLVTVKRICISHGIVPIDHAASLARKKNTNTPSQIITETAKRKVLAERTIPRPTLAFTHTLSPFVGNEKARLEKTQNIAAQKKIIRPRSTSSSRLLTRTTSGDLTDVIKKYWEKAGPDLFAKLEEGIENIPPIGLVSKRKLETIGPEQEVHSLKKSSFSLETIDQLNEKRVGGFWEDSEQPSQL